jgi:hypothetical protein
LTALNHAIKEWRIWVAISLAFLGLGISKLLDLPAVLAGMIRTAASGEGWYGQRQYVQAAFTILVLLLCGGIVMVLRRRVRDLPGSTRIALFGTTLLFGYVLIRAASLHQFDRFIFDKTLGFRWNWIFEMGGIGLVLAASWWRQRRAKNHQRLRKQPSAR